MCDFSNELRIELISLALKTFRTFKQSRIKLTELQNVVSFLLPIGVFVESAKHPIFAHLLFALVADCA